MSTTYMVIVMIALYPKNLKKPENVLPLTEKFQKAGMDMRLFRFFALCSVAYVALSHGTAVFAQDRIALVVGINSYEELSDLRAGVNDSEKIAAFYGGLGFRVWLVNDRRESKLEQPTMANLNRIMANIAELAADGGVREFIFFFAGHGVQIGGRNWLCLSETRLDAQTGMIDVDGQLVPWLRSLRAGLSLVFLDACRNDLGFLRAAGIGRGVSVEPTGVSAAGSGTSGDMAIFFAAKPGSFSYERPDGVNGFFTETLLGALQADTTQTIGDLYRQLRTVLPERTEKAYGRPQVPNLGGDFDPGSPISRGKVDISAWDGGGKVFVECDKPGALVTVNGVKRGQAPLLVEGLDPGAVTIEAHVPGWYAERLLTVAARSYQRVSLALEKVTGDVMIGKVRMGGTDESDGPRIEDAVRGMELRIDGQSRGTVAGLMLSALEPGSHNLQLLGTGWSWESQVVIKAREVVTVTPVFEPVGKLVVDVPPDTVVDCRNLADGRRIEFPGGSEVIDDFPAGSWDIKITGRRFEPSSLTLVVERGGRIELGPELSLRPEFARGQEHRTLAQEVAFLRSLLPAQRQSRTAFDALGWTGLGLGLASLAAGAACGYVASQSYTEYRQAGSADAATAKRQETLGYWNTAVSLLAGGLVVGIGVPVVGFVAGERPEVSVARIIELERRMAALEAIGIDW